MTPSEVTLAPTWRAYAGLDDFQAMCALLAATKRGKTAAGVHPGELAWWFYYIDAETDLTRRARLWYSDDTLVAWTFWSETKLDADYAIHPDWADRGLDVLLTDVIHAHLRACATALPAREDGKARETVIYAVADDRARIAELEARGFTGEADLVCFVRDLAEPLPEVIVPEGYHLLDRMRPELAAPRAEAHFSAFSPGSKMTEARYRHFMTAPNYDPETDVIAAADDGRPVAFAMAWADPTSGVGVFEPVGTHADHQRKGLGRATVREGLRRLRARGMRYATVNTGADNEGNIAFYQDAGFTLVNRILRYSRLAD